MKSLKIVFVAALLLATVCPAALLAQGLDDLANLKILKARARLLHQNKAALEEKIDDEAGFGSDLGGKIECGSIEIGNQAAGTGFSNDISIIITGDIINTDNHCVNTGSRSPFN